MKRTKEKGTRKLNIVFLMPFCFGAFLFWPFFLGKRSVFPVPPEGYTQPVGLGSPAILQAPLPGPEGNSS